MPPDISAHSVRCEPSVPIENAESACALPRFLCLNKKPYSRRTQRRFFAHAPAQTLTCALKDLRTLTYCSIIIEERRLRKVT